MTTQADNLWHVTSREAVDAPPLTEDARADLAVIGGGFSGLSAALHAARAGARVCLVEAREIGHGGSGRNVGLVNAGLWLPPDDIRAHLGDEDGDRLIALLAGAPNLVFDLIDRHTIACEPVRAGTLHCAHAPSGLADLNRRHAQLTAGGAPVTLLSASEAQARTGSPAVHGALFDPRAGTIQPLAYAQGLARAARQAGVQIHATTPALSINRDGDSWRIVTTRAEIRAGAVIRATGAYQTDLQGSAAEHARVNFFQYATAPLSADQRQRILPGGEGCWDTALVMSSFRTDAAGRLILGGMGDPGHTAGAIHAAWARRKLARLFPDLADLPLQQGWCGRIAMTSDHLPKLTRPGPNALAVQGYSGRGIAPGTLFGKAMAESLLGGSDSGLPVPVVDSHAERLTTARSVFFEAGATLAHLVGARL